MYLRWVYQDAFNKSRRLILPWMEVLQYKYNVEKGSSGRGNLDKNVLSLPNRLLTTKQILEQIKVYMLIPVTVDQQLRMRQLVMSCPQSKDAMVAGFQDWMMVVKLPNKTIHPDMSVFYEDYHQT